MGWVEGLVTVLVALFVAFIADVLFFGFVYSGQTALDIVSVTLPMFGG